MMTPRIPVDDVFGGYYTLCRSEHEAEEVISRSPDRQLHIMTTQLLHEVPPFGSRECTSSSAECGPQVERVNCLPIYGEELSRGNHTN